MSGPEAIAVCNRFFSGKDLSIAKGYTLHFGSIQDGDVTLDEVLVSLFKAPQSYTGEDSVEVSCHGSPYILQQVLQLFTKNGARLAKPGEFTQRAFLNKKMDLSQAEAVADLIAAESSAAHETAMHQMRGGFSSEIDDLRQKLIHFASMIELELDFSEEHVEFASRDDLLKLLEEVKRYIQRLIGSFDYGNAVKNGVPVVIVGKPNAGKSTLLNRLLNEDRALVTDIAGTTRDSIEDEIVMNGILYRFVDTAGLRETTDTVEALGVARSLKKLKEAAIIIYLYDLSTESAQQADEAVEALKNSIPEGSKLFQVANHVDKLASINRSELKDTANKLHISAKENHGIETLKASLENVVLSGNVNREGSVVTNTRHLQALHSCDEALNRSIEGLGKQTPGDFLAMDIRQALYFLAEITGEITTDDLLDNIFSKFCIGK